MRKDLSREVLPTHYDLSIDVKPEMFNGSVTMHLKAEKSISTFRFNSKNLELSNLEVKRNGKTIGSKIGECDNEFVAVHLNEEIVGDFTLFVEFNGVYSTSMEGFYKSKYNNVDLFSTHFEPADARQAFPCFDQPDMKATFSITLNVPDGFMALSNGALLEQSGTRFVFEKTPIMSTYIVAYVVGQLEYIEDDSYIPIRVYADKSEKHWGKFALNVATRCLKFYEEYFEAKYPLKKLDMVAIPSFAMGAMENWGLVTYRKTALLFDEKSTPIISKKNIAVTVCHELAHMWFGNLVTMKWWDDLWLNEGFATWAATLAIQNSLQDILSWDAWTSFINDEVENGMEMDCRKSTHRIGIEVNDPVEINQIFDAISYSKGSSVIKMLENWLGHEVFREGLVHYIKKFSYSNTITSDLWDSLSLIANQNSTEDENNNVVAVNVGSIVDPWIRRDGFPYLVVEEAPDQVKLTQKRFTVGYKLDDKPWPIPLRIMWIDKEVGQDVSASSKKIKLDNLSSRAYIMHDETFEIEKESSIYKINSEVSGFYRVEYPGKVLKRLFDYSLSTADRMNLFSDSFALAKALYTPLQDSLALVDYLVTENNHEVLLSVLSGLSYFRSVFYDSPSKVEFFTSKIKDIVEERFRQIDIKVRAEDINTISLHSLIVARAINIGLPEALAKLRTAKLSEINPEYLRPYLMSRIDDEFENTFNLYKTSTRPGEKQSALFALGATSIEKNIEFIFSNIEQIEPQDSYYVFVSFSNNLKFRNKAAMLLIENFGRIKKHIGNSSLVRASIEYLLSHVYQDKFKDKVIKFLDSIKEDREMKSAIEKCTDALSIGEGIRSKYSAIDFN
ncbi:uncharacterized protein VICG_00957 [Vittaforma corneae ATCC 50505]|uniref:Aminopeptidase n=1 Tax=Vittaforma corneae (strain ATCC 50505) TaxID=993615 RepID=L2GN63_VITCO|nr:uncharacterized protein VICG_00957 [Vittaforma corneae ATCC 50505]ELA41940.1 hypothetical protein VICG_00957 [Vittaforma corneae ATCC 50505]